MDATASIDNPPILKADKMKNSPSIPITISPNRHSSLSLYNPLLLNQRHDPQKSHSNLPAAKMPLNCWSLASRAPRFQFLGQTTDTLRHRRYPHTQFNPCYRFMPKTTHHHQSYCSLHSSVSTSKLGQDQGRFSSSTTMENGGHYLRNGFQAATGESYTKELEVAVRAVQMACSLCQKVQQKLISKSQDQVQAKEDNSPVTVADWSVQAIVSWILCETLGRSNVSIIAEEDVQSLSKTRAAGLLETVVQTVNSCLAEAPLFGFQPPEAPLDALQVLEAISRCSSTMPPSSKFWALDPVDGTLGFVRGDQYAVALSLIDHGEVVLGVLGCPNYPMRKEWLSYHHRYHRIVSRLTPPAEDSWDKGCVIYARKGSGEAWMQPLVQEGKKLVWPNSARRVRVSAVDNPEMATFCEPVEKANSSHSFTAGLAHSVGLRKQPLRVYSMVKYATIARGDAEVFMKFARTGYKEKIWDHAAGVVIVQEAGGVVTDAGGRPLDFSGGLYLQGLDRGIIASAGAELHERIIKAVDASWNSSSL